MILIIIFSIIYPVLNYLRIVTGFKPEYNKLNRLCITLLMIVGYSMPFLPQPRIYAFFDFKFPSLFYLLLAVGIPFFLISIQRFRKALKIIHGMTKGNAQPITLTTHGFFAECRHPFYGSAFQLSLAGSILTGTYIPLIPIILYLIQSYYGAKREEDEQLVPLFKEDYVKYRNRVQSMFFDSKQKTYLPIILIVYFALIGFTFFKNFV
ncbi:protein-s-isoprenylcysteine o-methyltransferase [Anaeramoeba flamelloides]|uniref:Protein-s-isoprenylcysteine o-methyltransferase n=1 Tax=Anaeramoeba flamelloides TaxID=1746091 RepID=A0ABQ8XQB5_9EUKA|nr:protein-s-isoprenylcysteine o-methyltransferase [Anaeramoeba flamelloides]